MGLSGVKEILRDAAKNKYGVASFNVFNFESIKWAVLAAEKEGMPVIIQFYPGFTVHISLKAVAEITIDLANNAKVPVGLHLDHARDLETAVAGIKAGFRSVMIDASTFPFAENARITAEVKRVAKVFDADVEGELGHVGSGSVIDDYTNPNNFTDPSEVKRFVELTETDSLAVSIGNGHGRYVKAPTLDFERISAIRAETDVPLVMHGGSDIPDDQIREAVNRGMGKFNIATEYARAMFDAQKAAIESNKDGSFFGVLRAMEEASVSLVINKIRLLNPNGYKA